MKHLSDLPNIGKELESLLQESGIKSIEQLKELGAERVFMQLDLKNKSACINKLLAIEGAIQGIRWHGLDKYRKEELKIFLKQYDSLNNKS